MKYRSLHTDSRFLAIQKEESDEPAGLEEGRDAEDDGGLSPGPSFLAGTLSHQPDGSLKPLHSARHALAAESITSVALFFSSK
jgi:hypothetical protein